MSSKFLPCWGVLLELTLQLTLYLESVAKGGGWDGNQKNMFDIPMTHNKPINCNKEKAFEMMERPHECVSLLACTYKRTLSVIIHSCIPFVVGNHS